MKSVRKRLTYANVMSSLAVFLVVAGGTAFAASQLGKESVGAKQLKKEAVTPAKISAAAKTALKGAAGPQGPAGPKGDKGEKGEPGLSNGPAGGALAGNYPNPSLAAKVVTAGKLAVINEKTATASIPKEGFGSATVSCAAGEVIISGGNDSFANMPVVASRQNGNGWAVFAHNESTTAAQTLTVHAYCLAGP
jgi:hypothetical protein